MPHVRILMATRNGAAHLPAQLGSLLAQTHDDWSLWASDDGSTDATPDLLAGFAVAHPGREVRLLDGPRRGAAANFLSLMAHPGLPPGPVALADQDDVWLPHRLGRGLAAVAGEEPAFYASATILADAEGRLGRVSSRHPRPPAFANALVQNVLAGNTLILNAAALALLRRTLPAALTHSVAHHDWWVYLVATGAGARVVLDPEPGLLYRQHEGNVMGAHRGPRVALARLGALGGGRWGDWVGRNLAALDACRDVLTPEARALADRLAAIRRLPGPLARLRALGATPLHRQTSGQDLALRATALMGRL